MEMESLALDDEQETTAILIEQSGKLFARHVTAQCLAAADDGEWQDGLWQVIVDGGLTLALLEEKRGGIGMDPVQAFRLVRMAASHAAPVPLGETMIAQALWGEPIEGVVTLMGPAADSNFTPRRLPYGRHADHLMARSAEGALILMPLEGIERRVGSNVAAEPRDDLSAAVDFDSVPSRPCTLGGPEGLMPHGALLRATQMCGAMSRAMDLTIDHALSRRQFGRPIAKFQAVQHMLAVGAGHLAASVAICDAAAAGWGRPEFAMLAGLAKSRTGEAAGQVAAIAHQVHAAMGFTQEHPLHYSTRRLWSWRDEFGGEAYWQERIGREVCADGGDALWGRILTLTSGRMS